MTDFWTEREEVPTLDVRVVRDGVIVHRELCETTEQASALAKQWGDIEDTTIEIVDLVAPDPSAAADEIELYDDDQE